MIPAHRNVCPSTYAFTMKDRGPYRRLVAILAHQLARRTRTKPAH